MTLKRAVELYMEKEGYDGLYRNDIEPCGCMGTDLMPCWSPSEDCTLGYVAPCCDCDHTEDCKYRVGCDADYLVLPKECDGRRKWLERREAKNDKR